MFTRLLIALLSVALLGNASSAFAASEAELQERFKDRFPQLQSLKQQGKVGETAAGFVEAVKPEFADEVSAVVAPENSDRRELYAMLAKRNNTTPEAVAARNAARNFANAKRGEWLKNAEGKWYQKE